MHQSLSVMPDTLRFNAALAIWLFDACIWDVLSHAGLSVFFHKLRDRRFGLCITSHETAEMG